MSWWAPCRTQVLSGWPRDVPSEAISRRANVSIKNAWSSTRNCSRHKPFHWRGIEFGIQTIRRTLAQLIRQRYQLLRSVYERPHHELCSPGFGPRVNPGDLATLPLGPTLAHLFIWGGSGPEGGGVYVTNTWHPNHRYGTFLISAHLPNLAGNCKEALIKLFQVIMYARRRNPTLELIPKDPV